MSESAGRTTFHHGNLKQAAIETGVAIVTEQGAGALKLDLLSKQLGVTPAALYRHFRNFDQLRADVAQAGRVMIAREMAAALDALPPGASSPAAALARFRALGDVVIAFAAARPNLHLYMYGWHDVEPSQAPELDNMAFLPICLDDLERHGLLDPAARQRATYVGWAGVHGTASLIALGAITGPEEIAAAWAAVGDGILQASGLPRS